MHLNRHTATIGCLLSFVLFTWSARAHQTPTEQRNLELFKQYITSESAADFDQMGRLFSEEFEGVMNGQPIEGKGPSVEVDMVQKTREAFPDYVVSADTIVAQGDHVAVGWRIAGTHTGRHAVIPLPPTNRTVDFTGCTIFEIKDDKMIRGFNYVDGATIMNQLGVTGVIGMVAYIFGGGIGMIFAGAAFLTYRRIARSMSKGRARLILGFIVAIIAVAAFLAVSFGVREMLNAAV